MAKATKKCKRVVLSIEEDSRFVGQVSFLHCNWRTVWNRQEHCGGYQKGRRFCMEFSSKMVEMGMSRKANVMKLGDDDELDQAVYLWFKQKRIVILS